MGSTGADSATGAAGSGIFTLRRISLRRRIVHVVDDAGYVAKTGDSRCREPAATVNQLETSVARRHEQGLENACAFDRVDEGLE